ncbi:MAG: hypothetical protein OEU36_19985, partial [Gammaproteobacteria bacterium]|nr:hypothetical protein [Gammaproteobacteria bacterium]
MTKRTHRKLTAIMAADVVGYSRLMGDDEAGTLDVLRDHREELIEPKIAEHEGRIAKLMGDGLLAEFPSAVEAVLCAVEIQQELIDRNSDVPNERKMLLRIGINIGDIIVEGNDIYGDGVNVAARLEGLAEPGGICVSDMVYQNVSAKLDVPFQDLGNQTLKNIDKSVRAWGVGDAVCPLEAPTRNPRESALSDSPSIAVLPFANMSGDAEQEYFSDGMTEDIITALTHWHSFSVIARNSTFTYKDRFVDVKQAAQELGARYLVEGSVRKGGGNRVRITAQLIDGASGHHIWAERYDRELVDIFEVQDEITQHIAATIAPELDKAEFKRSTAKHSEDLNAWDFCLRGMSMIREYTPEGNAKAREMFNNAIAIQPDYADAHAGLALSYNRDILLQCTEDRA